MIQIGNSAHEMARLIFRKFWFATDLLNLMRELRLGVFFLLLLVSPIANATCLDIDGVKFEAIGATSLLASRGGLNIAIVQVYGSNYEGGFPFQDIRKIQKLEFRFFSPKLCDSSGGIRFQINGELGQVRIIELFSK